MEQVSTESFAKGWLEGSKDPSSCITVLLTLGWVSALFFWIISGHLS